MVGLACGYEESRVFAADTDQWVRQLCKYIRADLCKGSLCRQCKKRCSNAVERQNAQGVSDAADACTHHSAGMPQTHPESFTAFGTTCACPRARFGSIPCTTSWVLITTFKQYSTLQYLYIQYTTTRASGSNNQRATVPHSDRFVQEECGQDYIELIGLVEFVYIRHICIGACAATSCEHAWYVRTRQFRPAEVGNTLEKMARPGY